MKRHLLPSFLALITSVSALGASAYPDRFVWVFGWNLNKDADVAAISQVLDAAGQQWEEEGMAATQGRICKPEEVANAALFLASDEASFVNGAALYVDNGWYAKG